MIIGKYKKRTGKSKNLQNLKKEKHSKVIYEIQEKDNISKQGRKKTKQKNWKTKKYEWEKITKNSINKEK